MESKKQQTSQTSEEDVLPIWLEAVMHEAGEMERYQQAGRQALNLLKLRTEYTKLPKQPFWQPLHDFLQKLAQMADVSLGSVLQLAGVSEAARVTAESASNWALLLKKIGLSEFDALFQIRLDATGMKSEEMIALTAMRARGNNRASDLQHSEAVLQQIESGYDESRYADLKRIHAAVKSAFHQ
ncbi:MAG: hypothetical protein AAB316_19300 [Bacteroidota bacterium]